jgi:putative PIN family toxin of toxin-antitoxin system
MPGSLPSLCLSLAQRSGVVLASAETLNEFTSVLLRSKFDRYLSMEARIRALAEFRAAATIVPVVHHVAECRHPKDDKFLELALSGRADVILTGDMDLLVLHPWRNIPILSPATYLAL